MTWWWSAVALQGWSGALMLARARRSVVVINADLVAEETRQAVAAYRDLLSAESEPRLSELAMSDSHHGL